MYLNINVNKVLNEKTPKLDKLTESFNNIKFDQTPKKIIEFMSMYKKSSKDTILENLNLLYNINSDITFGYFNNVLEHAELPNALLNEYKTDISKLIESTSDYSYSDKLEESITVIDAMIENNNDIELIREEMLLNLAINRIRKSCMFESYLEDDLEVLIYNINTSPETISEYEQLIRKIKVSKTSEYFSSYPMLLVKNTELIRNLTIRVTGDVLDLLTSMPIVIADKLTESNLSSSVVKSYIKILDKQIALMYISLKNNEPAMYQLYSAYVRNLINAKRKISEKYNISSIKESFDIENEIVEEKLQNPFKVMAHANKTVGKGGWSHFRRNLGPMTKNAFVNTSKSYKGLWPNLLKMVDNCKNIDEVNYLRRDVNIALSSFTKLKKNQPERIKAIEEHEEWLKTVYRKALSDKAKELKEKTKIKESFILENITEMQPDVVLYDEGVIEDVIAELEDSLANIIFDPDDELNETELENFARLARTYEATSKLQKGMIKAGHKAGSGAQKIVTKARSSQVDMKRATLPIKKAIDPIYNAINNTINKLKEMDKKDRVERIITGGFKLKLKNYIKKAINIVISVGAGSVAKDIFVKGAPKVIGGALGPLVGVLITAIGIYASIAIEKKTDNKVRQEVLTDLKNELTIVNEKIDDAKSDNNRKAKYELMRIQQKLKKDIERIEYNLN